MLFVLFFVQSKATPYEIEKAEALIDILSRRTDRNNEQFCLVLRDQNSDLADLLTKTGNKHYFFI